LPPGEHASLPLVEPLSEREREVLWHISEGRSNREIAEQLVVAPSTVKSHVRAIYAKLGVESRTQALARVRRLKLL
jgi:LuxR family maltose regulon positive regulatory protein